MKTALPSGSLRLSVIDRLLRCRFWKSGPWRGVIISDSPAATGISILIQLAPQSAKYRTQTGPARTRVKSSTVKRANGPSVIVASFLEGARPATSHFPRLASYQAFQSHMLGFDAKD